MTEAGLSDEQLSAELKKWTGASPALHPVGELLDRHWAAAFAYARLCTDGPRAAGMLTTAAFTRLFGASLRQSGPTAAWRPHVLVAVRRIAAEWDTDGRQELLHPALRSGDGTGERASARLLPPPGRRLLSRAFQRVPETSRALLWHTEVEAEPLAVPAALLGLDEVDARVELRRARERLREECLQAHRELAPEDDCQRYLRMLDVTFRRGATDIDPDLRQHLTGCSHCARTADQLACFNGGLSLALAEAVLGWGASGYLESRAADTDKPTAPAPAAATVAPVGRDAVIPRAGEAFAPAESAVQDDGSAPGRSPRHGTSSTRRRRGTQSTVAEGTDDVGSGVSGVGSARWPGERGVWRVRGRGEASSGVAEGTEGAARVGSGAGGARRTVGRGAFSVRRRGEASSAAVEATEDVGSGVPGVGSARWSGGRGVWRVRGRGEASSGVAEGTEGAARVGSGAGGARRAVGRRRGGVSSAVAEGTERAGSAVPGARSARRRTRANPVIASGAEGAGPGPTSRRSAQRAARRARRRNLALAVVTVSGLVVLPLALWSALGSDDGPASGAAGAPSRTPGGDAASPRPSWAGRNAPGQGGALHGRLRNLASGLCVGVVGDKAAQGAETELDDCSAAPTQQWTYETDGLLRSAAAPDLCLDSHLGYSVRLAPCTATGKAARDLHYDFTLQGTLVPRSDQELALTPAATDGSGALVLKTRAAGTAQRWSLDTAHPDLRMENVDWDGDSTPAPAPRP
ncbi:RICIN domain-containing protein [Streptomyces sp. NPDC052727]|uniref:RICIN domain-containing protein n=1 Tax=Streptomyces sp. NPDC052727 TaxID=3154854 RepID=UPI003443C882